MKNYMILTNKKMYIVFATLIILCASIIIYQTQVNLFSHEPHISEDVPIILWWTPFGSDGIFRTCKNYTCYFTKNRTFQHHPQISSFLFYGSNFNISDLPEWKASWGLIHEESPRNNPILLQEETLNLFRYSSTFSRFSDVPLNVVDLPGIKELLGKEYFVPTEQKTRLMNTKNLAPLLYIQSNCDTASNRDIYIAELMKYIRVDSYGACLNNAQFDRRLRENYLETLNSKDFLSFIANYKFTIAFENAVCEDYITEKLWRPLIVGSVPIYYGSPSFKDWLPNNMSAISVLDFKDPKSLASFLHDLINNETEYDKYLTHKLVDNYEIENQRLKTTLDESDTLFRKDFGEYINKFECFVCEDIQNVNKQKRKVVDVTHYDCPLPRHPITNKVNYDDWWTMQWVIEKCGAKVLAYHLKNNLTIDETNFRKMMMELRAKKEC